MTDAECDMCLEDVPDDCLKSVNGAGLPRLP